MSQANSQENSTRNTAPAKNIVDTAIGAGNFTTLAAGIKAAGLTDMLAGKGPFTVFAPTDEAFRKLPTGAVDALRNPEPAHIARSAGLSARAAARRMVLVR